MWDASQAEGNAGFLAGVAADLNGLASRVKRRTVGQGRWLARA